MGVVAQRETSVYVGNKTLGRSTFGLENHFTD
jgi:hypothetical protein